MIGKLQLPNRIQSNSKRGFTLIEFLIYICLVSIFVSGAVMFSWDVIYGREKANQEQIAEQNARITLAKIIYEIKRAKSIQSISSNQVILDNGTGTTSILLNSGTVQITSNGNGPYNITSNQVKVLQPPEISTPLFTNLTTADNNSKNIKVSVTVRPANNILWKVPAESIMSSSVELTGLFNQARPLLTNAKDITLFNNNTEIRNTTIGNAGNSNITISKMTVSWTGGQGGTKLNEIQINGSTTWSGSASSGVTVDITDTIIAANTLAVPVNTIRFSKKIDGTVMTIIYIMSDNSSRKLVIDFT